MKDDMVTYSKCRRQRMRIIFAIAVFREGTHIDKVEEDQSDHVGSLYIF